MPPRFCRIALALAAAASLAGTAHAAHPRTFFQWTGFWWGNGYHARTTCPEQAPGYPSWFDQSAPPVRPGTPAAIPERLPAPEPIPAPPPPTSLRGPVAPPAGAPLPPLPSESAVPVPASVVPPVRYVEPGDRTASRQARSR